MAYGGREEMEGGIGREGGDGRWHMEGGGDGRWHMEGGGDGRWHTRIDRYHNMD